MIITHNVCDGNNSRVAHAHFSSPRKTLDSISFHNSSRLQELVQKHHSQKITKPKAARLVHTSHDLDTTGFIDQANNTDNIVHNNQSLSELFTSKTITAINGHISPIILSPYLLILFYTTVHFVYIC